VNTNLVDSLLETVFFGGEGGGLEDQPRPRFKWQPPGGAAPGGDDLIPGDLGDYADAPIPPRGSITNVPKARPPAAVPPPPSEPDEFDDRTGKYSMDQMMPKSDVATTDDLLDFFNRIKKARGKAKKSMQREFDVRKPDFESQLHKFVDTLLTEAVCDVCGQEVGDRWFADRSRAGGKIAVCGTCYMKHDYDGVSDTTENPISTDWEDAQLGRQQSRRTQQSPPLMAP